MCGIAGILRWNGASPQRSEIECMTRQIANRGPDGEGYLVRDSIALGHRRLAIIDLTTGHQPICNEDETIWITFNGEIYNYQILRHDLESRGHRFSTQSDTEVIVHAYEEWGANCVAKFRGMFAFGLADFKKRCLLLARDHFGIKPLYYRLGANYLKFASEIVALRAGEDIPPTGNLQAIDYYLRFQYIPTPHTVFREIFKLPPASYLQIDFEGNHTGPVKYWDLNFAPEPNIPEKDWKDRLEEVINDSVRAHLIADVPFGVFLSGGIDSTLVALQMSRILEQPVKAFAIGFSEEEYSELRYAREAAERCGIELHTEILNANVLDMLPDLIAHYGEPFGDSSAVATWCVSRLARDQVKMVLSGDGGDEAFAGYDSYQYWMTGQPSVPYSRQIISSPRSTLGSIRYQLRNGNHTSNQLDRWQRYILYLSTQKRQKLWRPEFHHVLRQPSTQFEIASSDAKGFDMLAYAQYLDYQTYLPCDILTKVDVASMYYGLEVRTPLIDVEVVELASRLPLDQRLRYNEKYRLEGKYLPKQILQDTFPKEFVQRKKQGFALPRSVWFLEGQPCRKLLEDCLYDKGSRLHELFAPEEIHRQITIHNHKKDNSGPLWLLLVLSLWLAKNPNIEFK